MVTAPGGGARREKGVSLKILFLNENNAVQAVPFYRAAFIEAWPQRKASPQPSIRPTAARSRQDHMF
jgi:hypothetical protein